jgi:hypothetical protein
MAALIVAVNRSFTMSISAADITPRINSGTCKKR